MDQALVPGFSFAIDKRHGMMRITLSGFFGVEDIARFDVARREALAELGCAPNSHLTLCDVSACKLQSQDIVSAFKRVIDDSHYAARRLAIVTGSSLARMQVRRLLERADTACFTEIAEAEAWLLQPDAAAQPG